MHGMITAWKPWHLLSSRQETLKISWPPVGNLWAVTRTATAKPRAHTFKSELNTATLFSDTAIRYRFPDWYVIQWHDNWELTTELWIWLGQSPRAFSPKHLRKPHLQPAPQYGTWLGPSKATTWLWQRSGCSQCHTDGKKKQWPQNPMSKVKKMTVMTHDSWACTAADTESCWLLTMLFTLFIL